MELHYAAAITYGVDYIHHCITKMEAIMKLLSSNTSHPDFTLLWNFSKSYNLQISNILPMDNLATARQPKTKLRNMTAKLVFSKLS
jgi:hypothetical protein